MQILKTNLLDCVKYIKINKFRKTNFYDCVKYIKSDTKTSRKWPLLTLIQFAYFFADQKTLFLCENGICCICEISFRFLVFLQFLIKTGF